MTNMLLDPVSATRMAQVWTDAHFVVEDNDRSIDKIVRKCAASGSLRFTVVCSQQ